MINSTRDTTSASTKSVTHPHFSIVLCMFCCYQINSNNQAAKSIALFKYY